MIHDYSPATIGDEGSSRNIEHTTALEKIELMFRDLKSTMGIDKNMSLKRENTQKLMALAMLAFTMAVRRFHGHHLRQACPTSPPKGRSLATHDLVESYFECEYRGTVAAKNKGNVGMYYVNGLRDKFAADPDKRVPNIAFLREIQNFG